ncbi:MAG: hypothetical protein H6741_00235 [Alphaproteobacteria bacterium]|nr:hypothetical protein [Alphaproteobacteria bacterium]MCB9791132.1 hypothetical protein [Alphaproteobacteria bacterium]
MTLSTGLARAQAVACAGAPAPAVVEPPAPPRLAEGRLEVSLHGEAPDWSGWREAPTETPEDTFSPELLLGSPSRFAPDAAARRWFWSQADAVQVSVIADGATARALAQALSKATRLTIAVQPAVAERQVMLALPEVPLTTVLQALWSFGLLVDFDQGVLLLRGFEGPQPPARDDLAVRALPLPDDADPIGIAEVVCGHALSGGGTAHVAGGWLLLHDTEGHLEVAERLLEALTNELEEE